jgi:hypothetical protein
MFGVLGLDMAVASTRGEHLKAHGIHLPCHIASRQCVDDRSRSVNRMILISFIHLVVNLESVPRNDEVYMITSNDDLEDPTRGCPCIRTQLEPTPYRVLEHDRGHAGGVGMGEEGGCITGEGVGERRGREGRKQKRARVATARGRKARGAGALGARGGREGSSKRGREGKRTRGGKAQKGTGEWSYGERHIVQM